MEDLADIVFKKSSTKDAWIERVDGMRNLAIANTSSNEFYLEMRPLLYAFRLFARLPYRRSSDGKLTATFRPACVIFWSLMYSAQTFVALQNIFGVIALIKAEVEYFKVIAYSINLVMMALHFYVPISIIIESRKLCDFFNKWKEFEDTFAATTGKKFTTRYNKTLRILLIMSPIEIVGLVFLESNILYFVEWYQLGFYGYLIAICHMNLFFWIFSLLEMGHTGNLIKLQIEKVVSENHSICTTKDVFCLRKLWLKLSKLMEIFGNAFGFTTIVLMILNHMCFVTASFALIASLIKDPSESPQFLAFIFINATMIVAVAESAQRAVDKVGKEISDTLINLDTRHFSEETKRELDIFSSAVSTHCSGVCLKGFLTIDRTTLTSMLGITVTYLIVLVQFQSTPK